MLIIMLTALVMLLGLQTYLSVADYQRKKVVFTNDLDSLLHRIDRSAQARRLLS